MTAISPASGGVTVDRPSLMAPADQLTLVADRLHEILITGDTFDAIYRHDRMSDLSFGQLVETLPPAVDDAALRRHYELVAGAKTGALSNVE